MHTAETPDTWAHVDKSFQIGAKVIPARACLFSHVLVISKFSGSIGSEPHPFQETSSGPSRFWAFGNSVSHPSSSAARQRTAPALRSAMFADVTTCSWQMCAPWSSPELHRMNPRRKRRSQKPKSRTVGNVRVAERNASKLLSKLVNEMMMPWCKMVYPLASREKNWLENSPLLSAIFQPTQGQW